MKNQTLLAGLQAAMKDAIGVGDFSDGVLQPGKLARFIRVMRRGNVVLPEVSVKIMDSNKEDIDRMGFTEDIFTQGVKGDGSVVGAESEVKPTFSMNQLVACEYRGMTGIKDRALRRNIERGGFENTLVDRFGEAAGRNMEQYGMLSDKTIPAGGMLSLTDGWLEKAGTKLEDVDKDAANWPLNMFQAMIVAMPKRYWANPGTFRFYVPWEVGDAYRNLHIERKYNLSDRVLTDGTLPPYKGVPVVAVPCLDGSTLYDVPALLSTPPNMVWGIFKEVTIEPDRKPADRKTNFHITTEMDFHYEDEDAAVATFIEKS